MFANRRKSARFITSGSCYFGFIQVNVNIEIHQALRCNFSVVTFVLLNRSHRTRCIPNDPNEIYCRFCQRLITSEEAFNLAKVAILALST